MIHYQFYFLINKNETNDYIWLSLLVHVEKTVYVSRIFVFAWFTVVYVL